MSDPNKIVLSDEATQKLAAEGIDPKLFDDLYRGTSGGQPTITDSTQLVVVRDDEETIIWVRGEGEA